VTTTRSDPAPRGASGGPAEEAFFRLADGRFVPAPHARGWWTPGMIHGRLLGGLLARTVEHEQSAPGLHFARLTVDLFRNAAMSPLRVETALLRDGRRIRVAEATIHGEDGPVAKASAVLLRHTDQPSGRIPATPPWDAPSPDTMPARRARSAPQSWRFTEDGTQARRWPGHGKRRAWVRETCDLVDGEPLTPFVRAALAADTASPLSHAGDSGLEFINADYTLHLSRLPIGTAIGLESGGHSSTDGIAVGNCTMHDLTGPIGYCATTAVANPGGRSPRRP
jgi:hypothetical protein